MIDRKKFFDALRGTVFAGGQLKQGAVVTLDAVLDEFERRGALPPRNASFMSDVRHVAYMMATIRGECGIVMVPVREGFSKSDAAGRAYVRRQGYRYAIEVAGQVFYGRGLVQLTWHANYKRMTELAKKAGHAVDFVATPDLVLEPKWAIWILFEGMTRSESFKGDFTAYSLEDFFNATKDDAVNARRIINGTDKAAQFAAWHRQFLAALLRSS